jgi:hypothetical protein
MNRQMDLTEESPVLALAKNDGAPAWCHRHLARGEHRPAAHTKVWIELDGIVTTPDLCQTRLDDLDSWLRLFGIRESPDDGRLFGVNSHCNDFDVAVASGR